MSVARLLKQKPSQPIDTSIYARVFRDLPHDVQLLDPESFRVIAANGMSRRESGCVPLDGHCNQHHQASGSDCTPPNHLCPIQRCLDTKQTAVVEHRHVEDDGTVSYHEAVVAPIFDNDGSVDYLLHITRDITEQVALRHKIIEAERIRNFTVLARYFGHQFLNKLGGIVQLCEMMGEEEDATRVQEVVPLIASCASELSQHARRLMDLSRPASEEVEYLDPNHQLTTVLEELRRYGLLDSLSVSLDLSDDARLVMMGRDELSEIIRNITINAWQAMQESPRRALTISTRVTADSMVELAFRDSGPGIPEPLMATITQPFVTTKSEGKGSGLGLSIVKSLAQKYGGYLRLTSRPERGTTVVVGIPLSESV